MKELGKKINFNIQTGLCVFFLICSALLFLFIKSFRANRDEIAPELIIAEEDIEYSEGEDESRLLTGIEAEDNVDGNVTDSIRVRSIYYAEDSDYAIVTYVAKDSSNNVGYGSRRVTVQKTNKNLNEEHIEKEDEAGSNKE